ncbi:MAG TPA: efflux RND transporter permease subunit, partial [Gemmataceae bacterium]
IKQIPEVKHVLGKIGRVESALDPAPVAMIETYVMLRPKSEWREGVTERAIWDEINEVATLPGVTPASPLQPIEGRVVMLQSGIKAPMAVRIYGDSLAGLAEAARAVADVLRRKVPQVDAKTVNPDIVLGKPYLQFEADREGAARYGVSVEEANRIVEEAIGGVNITRTVEGRERYPISVRYQREWRERLEGLGEMPVVTPKGETVPLGELAKLSTYWGPGEISSEDARLAAHVMFAPSGMAGDLETVGAAMAALEAARAGGELKLPAGYELEAVGSFRNQIEANERLRWIIPLVVLSIFFLVYLQFRNVPTTFAAFTGIPVAFAGGMILVAAAGVEMNTAVWVGFIAVFGIADDDGVVMATYLDQVFARRRPKSIPEIRAATVEAGLRRIRPCLMTTLTTVIALVPVLTATGRGADVARAMAMPILGGMMVQLVTLFVVPVIYCGYMEFKLRSGLEGRDRPGTSGPDGLPVGPEVPGPGPEPERAG